MPAALPYGSRTMPLPASPFRLEPVAAPPAGAAAGGSAAIEAALDRPLGGPPLRRIFSGARRVLIAVSDATRSTGCARYLPPLLERIRAAGPAEVTFIVGSGLHRRPGAADVRRILGAGVAREHAVLLHDPDDPAGLVTLGRTRAGTPVAVHRALREHDRIVLTGAVGFHYYAGFTGGRKAVVPGLAGRETIVSNHLRSLRRDGTRHPRARAGCLDGNPVHRDMADGAALVGPHLLVNAVPDEAGGIERLFVGHWRRAHEAACRHVRRTRTVRLAPREIVVVSAGGTPHDIDLIQSHKAFEAAFPALAPGGTLVLVARCARGAGHADFLAGFEPDGETAKVAALRRDFRVYAQTALSWYLKARACRLILVSGLPEEQARRLGARPAPDLGAALAVASRYHPKDARGWVIPWGGKYRIEPATAR